MEENNEYGNCWEDLMTRIDMENRVADARIRAWQVEEERKVDGGGECAINDENGLIAGSGREIGRKRVKKEECGVEKRRVKERTGTEMHKIIKERDEVRNTKRTKTEARRMVQKGKMRTLDRYFKRNSSDDD
jgi:hypothetical protein